MFVSARPVETVGGIQDAAALHTHVTHPEKRLFKRGAEDEYGNAEELGFMALHNLVPRSIVPSNHIRRKTFSLSGNEIHHFVESDIHRRAVDYALIFHDIAKFLRMWYKNRRVEIKCIEGEDIFSFFWNGRRIDKKAGLAVYMEYVAENRQLDEAAGYFRKALELREENSRVYKDKGEKGMWIRHEFIVWGLKGLVETIETIGKERHERADDMQRFLFSMTGQCIP